ncbi:MAG: hypothetical protein ACOC93_02585 [Planctomycetota bacterium]
MDVDRFIEYYTSLRQQKEDLEQRHKEELAPLKEKMAKVEAALQKVMNENNLTNLKGQHGTAYLSTQASVRTRDKDELLQWARGNERWDALDIKPNKTVAQQEDLPGVDVSLSYKVNVRKK